MIEKIKQLEITSKLLEPAFEERDFLLKKSIMYSEKFLESLKTLHTYNSSTVNGNGLSDLKITNQPINSDIQLIRKFSIRTAPGEAKKTPA